MIDKHLEGGKMTKDTSERAFDGSKKEVHTRSTNEQNGQYFVVGGEVTLDALNSVTEQGPTSGNMDELLHNHMNICVYNAVLLNNIPCEKEIEIETSGSEEECQKASESVRLTADILSTSLALVTHQPDNKEDGDLKNFDVEITAPNRTDIPESDAAPAAAEQVLYMSNNLSSDALITLNQITIPSSNSNVAVTSSLNSVAQNHNMTRQDVSCSPLISNVSPPSRDTPSKTGMNLDQLNRPPENYSLGKSVFNQQDEVQSHVVIAKGNPPEIAADKLSLTRNENIHPPDINQLHIRENEAVIAPQSAGELGTSGGPKVKKKAKQDRGRKVLSLAKISTKSLPKLKHVKQAGKGRDIASQGMKKFLGEWITAKRMPTKSVETSSVALFSEKNRRKAFSMSSQSSSAAETNVMQPIVAQHTKSSLVPAKQLGETSSSQIQPVLTTAGDTVNQQRETASLARTVENTDTASASLISDEMIPTVVQEIEKDAPEEPLQKRKKYKRKK